MISFREAQSDSELDAFCSIEDPGKATPALVRRHTADAHWIMFEEERPAARCSLWWSSTPVREGDRVGLIGHFAATAPGAHALLVHACQELARHGCTLAIGPMDGNTWRRYRVMTYRGQHPAFFLEPDNPEDWPATFGAAGFAPLAEYYSARTDALATVNPRIEAVWRRLSGQGFSVRTFDPGKTEPELLTLYDLAIASFQSNFLYTPLAKEEFLDQYRSVMPYVRPELVLIAERDAVPAGFLFAVPDLLEAKHGAPSRTFIIKTLAVHPRFGGRGLGSVLLWQANCVAHALGYTAAIHALMHQDNESMRISGREGSVFRHYMLYSRSLRGPA